MENTKQNIVIIGGMATGCKTAARLKRINTEFDITVIEKKPFVSYGTCGMPYFASGEVDGFFDLAKTSWGRIRDVEYFKKAKDINVLIETQVENIDYKTNSIDCLNIKDGDRFSLPFDKLVICTGAKAKEPPFPVPESDKISTFHNPLDAKKFRELAQSGKISKAVIIGAGFIGCELAESLVNLWGIETHLVELENRLLPTALDKEMSLFLEKTFSNKGINLHLSSKVEKVNLNGSGNPVVHLFNGGKIDSDYVFLCVGIKPEVELARLLGINIGKKGGILVDSQMRTNLKNVWAGGDCVEVNSLITGKPGLFPFGSLANRQGRVIADSISGLNSEFKGAVGNISLKVFGLIVASCGLSEDGAIEQGYEVGAVWGSWHDRPDYHPDSKSLFGKILYEKSNLKLLGLQLAGRGEVTRYIDIFANMISNRATVYDLLDFEHAYTPPHSSPLNPLNSLGAMAISQEEGVCAMNPLLLEKFDGNILDIREQNEIVDIKLGKAAMEFPIMEYRYNLDKFDKDELLLIVCQKGPRSYEAARTFINAGSSNVMYLGGGLQFAKTILDDEE
ncbi:MAG: FAD-dependent oxidoreductase [Ignavibacteriae bacterium]|nr:FAD-dependent oxidoreductase [Ignavibacteriota bacterium]